MFAQLAPDARISDIIHTLPDPIDYISGVVRNFILLGYDRETSKIRIGTTGAGIFPNYKIEKPSIQTTITLLSKPLELTCTPASTLSGRNHREMTELDDLERRDENWSTATISFAELEALRSRLWAHNRTMH